MPFTPSQDRFRFYEDGTEAGSTAIAAQDTNITRNPSSAPQLLLRVGIQETSGFNGELTDDWSLKVSKNGGAYVDVTTTSSNVKAFNSGSLTEAAATTERLTGGTGSWNAGAVSEDGVVDNIRLIQNRHMEVLYALSLVAADLAGGDALDFRVYLNGAAITYTITPRITVAGFVTVADALAAADALALKMGKVLTEAATITDALAQKTGKVITDATGLADAVSTLVTRTVSVPDALTILDALAQKTGKVLTESVTLGETVQVLLTSLPTMYTRYAPRPLITLTVGVATKRCSTETLITP